MSATVRIAQGALRVLFLLALLALPGIALSLWVLPNAAGPFVIGTLPAITAVTRVGPRLGAQLAAATAVVGFFAVLAQGDPWVAAALVGITAGVAGRFARRGLESPVLMVPVVAAYIVTEPGKFAVGRTLEQGGLALAGVTGVVLLGGGLWAAVLGKYLLQGLPKASRELTPEKYVLPYSLSVGIASGMATLMAALWAPSTSAAWMVLTVILVIRPTRDEMLSKTRDRLLGTVGGGMIAAVVVITADSLDVPGAIVVLIGLITLAVALTMQPSLAYWKYVLILTPGVVLLEGPPSAGLSTDLARVGLTVAGALTAVVVAVMVRSIGIRLSSRH